MDYAWYPSGAALPVHYLPNISLPTSQPGPYLVVVRNVCGVDSAWVTPPLDPALCVPPTIDSTWYSMMTTQNGETTLFSMAQGTCLEPVQWIGPGGQSWQGHYWNSISSLALTQPEIGTYQVVATNDCGADTALINVDCKPQIISAHMSPPPPCSTGPVQITSSVQGAYPVQAIWHTPNGGMFSITSCTQWSMVAGAYVLVATNHCGSDSMTVFLEFDTTGVGACVPPQILGVTSNGPICDGDTVELQAEVIAGGPCLDIVWSGHSVVQSHSDHTIAPDGYGDYTVTVTNACGSASGTVESEVINYIPLDVAICDSISSPVGLFSLIWEIPPGLQDGGTWNVDGAPHSPYFDTATDQAGTYSYQPPGLDCIAVDLHIAVNRSDQFAGVSDSITVCSSDPPFEMYPFLGGTPGGIWMYGYSYVSGIYDPATNYPGNFTYEVGELGDCWTQAVLTITEIGAQTWYADLDGDGFGDPDIAVEACDPPDGHVADASDNCPQVPGLIGDPCDDGNASTSGDVLSADCLCAGEYHVGIAENDDRHTVLWPNPLRQGSFRLDLPTWRGPVLITITDATGRVVMRQAYTATAAPLEVELPRAIAAATYWVNVLHPEGTTTHRLVVER